MFSRCMENNSVSYVSLLNVDNVILDIDTKDRVLKIIIINKAFRPIDIVSGIFPIQCI